MGRGEGLQRLQARGCPGRVVREGGEIGQVATRCPQGPFHLPGLADPCKADLPPGGGRTLGHQAGCEEGGTRKGRHQLRIGGRKVCRHQEDHGVGPRQTRRQGLAERAGGEDAAVAERPFPVPRLAVADHQGQGLADGRVLVAIVHQEDVRAAPGRRQGARCPVPGHPDSDARQGGRQHQGLITHVTGRMVGGVDLHRACQRPAIAPGQDGGPASGLRQPPCQGCDHGGLADSAEGKVADADHRNARVDRPSAGEPAGARSRPDPGQGLQEEVQQGTRATLPQIPPARRRELHATPALPSGGGSREAIASRAVSRA